MITRRGFIGSVAATTAIALAAPAYASTINRDNELLYRIFEQFPKAKNKENFDQYLNFYMERSGDGVVPTGFSINKIIINETVDFDPLTIFDGITNQYNLWSHITKFTRFSDHIIGWHQKDYPSVVHHSPVIRGMKNPKAASKVPNINNFAFRFELDDIQEVGYNSYKYKDRSLLRSGLELVEIC